MNSEQPKDYVMRHQTKFGIDAKATRVGNCFMTCVANILDMEIVDVPNIETLYRINEKFWFEVFWKWLDTYGYYYEQITDDNPYKKDELYLANGMTDRNSSHTVIYRNGELFFDPFPNGTGLVDIEFYSVIRKYK